MELTVKRKIKAFISQYLIKDGEISWGDDTSFIEEGLIDSVGVMELVAFLEVTFNFRVEDEEINPDNLDSVIKLVAYVGSKLNK